MDLDLGPLFTVFTTANKIPHSPTRPFSTVCASIKLYRLHEAIHRYARFATTAAELEKHISDAKLVEASVVDEMLGWLTLTSDNTVIRQILEDYVPAARKIARDDLLYLNDILWRARQ
jgi:hypothetical protein